MSDSPPERHANVRRYRERMQAQGLRQVQLWLPDTRSPAYAAECRRQSLLVAEDPADGELMDALEPLQDLAGWRP